MNVEMIKEFQDAQADINLYDVLNRLNNNPDFKLFVKNYTETLAIKLIKQKGMLVKEGTNTDNLDKQLDAIGLFHVHMEEIKTNGQSALNTVEHLNNQEDL